MYQIPDHVTRYNRRPNRWMCETYRPSGWDVASVIVIGFAVASLIVVAAIMLNTR